MTWIKPIKSSQPHSYGIMRRIILWFIKKSYIQGTISSPKLTPPVACPVDPSPGLLPVVQKVVDFLKKVP